MKDAFVVSMLSLVPRKTGARAMGIAARNPLSRLGTWAFAKIYGVDLQECEGELSDFHTLEELFTRTLKPGSREISSQRVVSPVDGKVAYAGDAKNAIITLSSGKSLNIATLVGEDVPHNISVIVIYLSPTDYHRVHCPVDGAITWWSYVPGDLWPVFPAAVRRIDNLFSKNERCVLKIEGKTPLYEVLVGAFGVGRIEVRCTKLLSNTGAAAHSQIVEPADEVKRGDEVGVFHLGSTVILAGPNISWCVNEGQKLKMGEAIV